MFMALLCTNKQQQSNMKKFKFTLYIRTAQKQEFTVGVKTIQAKNIDIANSMFNKLDLPFHHFSTVQKIS